MEFVCKCKFSNHTKATTNNTPANKNYISRSKNNQIVTDHAKQWKRLELGSKCNHIQGVPHWMVQVIRLWIKIECDATIIFVTQVSYLQTYSSV